MGTIFLPSLTTILELTLVPSLFESRASLAYSVLWISTFLVGCGNGLVEIAINPLAGTLYPRQKTHYLNILHAWWPGVLIMSVLLAMFVINPLLPSIARQVGCNLGNSGWKVKMGILLI